MILTNEHLVEIEQSAIFSRKVSELDLDSIEDASAIQQGFIQTMLHFGKVLVQTAGELPNFNFAGLPFPYEISQKIMEIKEAYMKNCRTETAMAGGAVPKKEVSAVPQNQEEPTPGS